MEESFETKVEIAITTNESDVMYDYEVVDESGNTTNEENIIKAEPVYVNENFNIQSFCIQLYYKVKKCIRKIICCNYTD